MDAKVEHEDDSVSGVVTVQLRLSQNHKNPVQISRSSLRSIRT